MFTLSPYQQFYTDLCRVFFILILNCMTIKYGNIYNTVICGYLYFITQHRVEKIQRQQHLDVIKKKHGLH